MRVTRVVAGSTAVVTAVLGLSLATASPAAAAESGTWVAYGNTNPITSSSSTWGCAGTKTLGTDVLAQVCAIRAANNTAVQAAIIVRNNRSTAYTVSGSMDLYTSNDQGVGQWGCSSKAVAANGWTVCFGRSVTLSKVISVNSVGTANAVSLGLSPYV